MRPSGFSRPLIPVTALLATLLLALSATGTASAAPPGKAAPPEPALTLRQVLALAAAHPSLPPLERAVAEAEARAGDARRRDPDTAAIEVENFGGRAGSNATEATFSYGRPFFDRTRAAARRAAADAEIDAAKLALSAAKRRAAFEAQAAFHALVATVRLRDAARAAAAVAGETLAVVKARLEAGAATENDRLRAEVERTRADTGTRRYEGEAAVARAALALALGRRECPPGRPEAPLSANLALPPAARLEAAMVATHPDLLALAQAESERAANERALSAERRRATRLIGGVRASREEERAHHAFVAGVEAELPRPGTNAGALAAARGAAERLRLQQAATAEELSARLREAIERFEASRALARDFRDRLAPRAKSLLDQTLAAYAAGKTDLIAVLEARRALAEAQIEHLEALRAMVAAADAVEALTGVCVVGEVHP